MPHKAFLFLLHAVLLLFPLLSFAGTGILEVHSEPSGAVITIDDAPAGTTPYQNLDAPAGKHRIKAFFSPEYPPQIQEVVIDERFPNVVVFKFTERSRGKFVGKEIVSTTMKHSGNVTFASIPTGALVVINGDQIRRPAPIGYTEVEVGKYQVEFQLDGQTLRTEFDVIQGETVKLIADFGAGKVINKWEQAKQIQQTGKQQAEKPQRAENRETVKREEAAPVHQTLGRQAAALPAESHPQHAVTELSAESYPQSAVEAAQYGELVITVNVRRDANLKYADFFDVVFPKLPEESISGPLFPKEPGLENSVLKDNFEYMSDDRDATRKFVARVDFSSREARRAEGGARSSIMTVQEGTYDLNISLRRMVDTFYSLQKLVEENARETVEIVRGQRLVVNITSHLAAENKLRYGIMRTYEPAGKKSRSADASAPTSFPAFTGANN